MGACSNDLFLSGGRRCVGVLFAALVLVIAWGYCAGVFFPWWREALRFWRCRPGVICMVCCCLWFAPWWRVSYAKLTVGLFALMGSKVGRTMVLAVVFDLMGSNRAGVLRCAVLVVVDSLGQLKSAG